MTRKGHCSPGPVPGSRSERAKQERAGSEEAVGGDQLRSGKVNRVRAALAEGSYDEEELLDLILVTLAEDMDMSCREDDEAEL